MEIDLHRLPEMLGIPVIPVSAQKRTGLDILLHAIAHHRDQRSTDPLIHHHISLSRSEKHAQYAVVYSDDMENRIDRITLALKRRYPQMENYRWHALKLLEQDQEITEKYPVNLPDILDRSYESDIINQKYDFIEEIIQEVLVNREKQSALTARVDGILLHNLLAIPAFLCIMALVFFLTFTIGDWLKGYLEAFVGWSSDAAASVLASLHTNPMMISLVVDGIMAGVGGILSFLPNIFILFLALAFLEDSGYMARVAYVMNETMGRVGLSGKAFLPMLLGFGCTVPAVMAARALPSEKDRRRTILITPFMSCSARLPIYVLFAEMFFPRHALIVAYSLYLIGLIMAIAVAHVTHRMSKGGEEDTLLIELPEYKTPNMRTVAIYVWDKVKDYLSKAGTTIFLASIVLWFVLNSGPSGFVEDVSNSFAAMIGRVLVPVLNPAGLGDWRIAVALISGLSAKEVVVSSFSVLFGIGNINSAGGMNQLSGVLSSIGFSGVNAYALMIFCLLYSPCIAAVATIRKETGSTRWTLGMVLFQLLTAWGAAVLVFQIGSLLF